MKLKTWLLKLGLLLAVMIGFSLLSSQTAFAVTLPDDVPIPAGASRVNMDKSVSSGYLTAAIVPGTTLDGPPMRGVPTLLGVAANNLSSTNRITKKTTKIYLLIMGSIFLNTDHDLTSKFTSLRLSAFDQYGKPLTSSNAKEQVKTPDMQVDINTGTYQEIDVDLSDLQEGLPVYLGFSTQVDNSPARTEYYFFKVTSSTAITAAMAPVAIKNTDASNTSAVPTVKSTDKTLTGTAEPNADLEMKLTDAAGTEHKLTGTVGADGKFTLNLGDTLGNLSTASEITLYESNDMGDMKSGVANVRKVVPLDVTATNPNVTLTTDEIASEIAGKSDSQILAWIADKAGVVVTRNGTTLGASDGITYTTSATGLAKRLTALTDQDKQTTIAMGATDAAGDESTAETTITLTRDAHFAINYSPSISFGTMALPSKETLIAPDAISLQMANTENVGSAWHLDASATTLTSAAQSKTLNGGIVYVDAAGNQLDMTDRSVEIADGTRAAGDDTLDFSKDWAQSSNAKKTGIFLDAKPNTYTGAGTSYSGSITWTLTKAP